MGIRALVLLAPGGFAGTRQTRPAVAVGGPVAPELQADVQFPGAGGLTLAGQLVVPPTAAPVAGVVVIPDLTAANRDGFQAAGQPSDPLYADLAAALASAGIASLRYDPRGRGLSVSASGATPDSFLDLVGDARAAVRFLAGRYDVAGGRIAVIGDGTGGLVALQLAVEDPGVSALVLVSTPGAGLLDALAAQLTASSASSAQAATDLRRLREAAGQLTRTGTLPPWPTLPSAVRALLVPESAATLRQLLAVQPTALASRIEVPLLVVKGGQDPAALGDPALAAAAHGAELTVAGAGPTLALSTVVNPAAPAGADPAEAMAALHDAAGAAVLVRDQAALRWISRWIRSHLPVPSRQH